CDEEINNAVCTCFLENIMNRVPEPIDPATLVHFLGPKSRDFCKAWDEWPHFKYKASSRLQEYASPQSQRGSVLEPVALATGAMTRRNLVLSPTPKYVKL